MKHLLSEIRKVINRQMTIKMAQWIIIKESIDKFTTVPRIEKRALKQSEEQTLMDYQALFPLISSEIYNLELCRTCIQERNSEGLLYELQQYQIKIPYKLYTRLYNS